MARLPRLFVPGFPQLVLQRGIQRSPIFADEAYYQQYLGILRDAARESSIQVHAYALMPDHVHLLFSAADENAPGRALQQIGRRYVRYYNDRHQRTGTLWEGRYRSTAIEPARFLIPCYRYLDLNPVRAGLVADPAHFAWTSCRHHLGITPEALITDHPLFWALGNTPFERQAGYRALLDGGPSEDELEAIRYAAHRGWLLGEIAPKAGESAPNRRITPLTKGRPRGSKKASEEV
jgi:putative transposase